MTTRAKANLNPDSQQWGRSIEEDIAYLKSLRTDGARDDTEVDDILKQHSELLSKVAFELKTLYLNLGEPYPPVETPPAPTPPVETKFNIVADWSRTWGTSSFYTGSDRHTNGTYLYQGSNPENKIGMWHFNTSSLIGKKIISADMFLANIDIPYQSSTTAGFGTHNNGSPPAGKPSRHNGFDVGWGRGEGKWFALPGWTYGGLSDGSITGFTVGGNGGSDGLYAFWQGVGQASPPALRGSYYA